MKALHVMRLHLTLLGRATDVFGSFGTKGRHGSLQYYQCHPCHQAPMKVPNPCDHALCVCATTSAEQDRQRFPHIAALFATLVGGFSSAIVLPEAEWGSLAEFQMVFLTMSFAAKTLVQLKRTETPKQQTRMCSPPVRTLSSNHPAAARALRSARLRKAQTGRPKNHSEPGNLGRLTRTGMRLKDDKSGKGKETPSSTKRLHIKIVVQIISCHVTTTTTINSQEK